MEDKKEQGRFSTPASVPSLTERLSDHILARGSFGSGGGGSMEGYKDAAKETAGKLYEKSTYVATGAYTKASQAKHAALDWITSMT